MLSSVVTQSKGWEENCKGRYLRGLSNQNGKHFVNQCEPNILEASQITTVYSEWARALFSFESTSNIKIKLTHHRVLEMDAFR